MKILLKSFIEFLRGFCTVTMKQYNFPNYPEPLTRSFKFIEKPKLFLRLKLCRKSGFTFLFSKIIHKVLTTIATSHGAETPWSHAKCFMYFARLIY